MFLINHAKRVIFLPSMYPIDSHTCVTAIQTCEQPQKGVTWSLKIRKIFYDKLYMNNNLCEENKKPLNALPKAVVKSKSRGTT